jgi:hypothetical protein
MSRAPVSLWCPVVVALLASPLLAGGLTYPPGFALKEVPDPLSGQNPKFPLVPRAAPAPGESFFDLRFGTILTRATTRLRHEYSRFDPFNAGQSLILLDDQATGEWPIYRTQGPAYDTPQNLVTKIAEGAEPRWDPADPKLLWFLRDFCILQLNTETKQETVVKDFSKDPLLKPILKRERDLYRITTKDEGETSLDKRYWALCLQGANQDYRLRYLFTWDRTADKILALHKLTQKEADLIDWVGMSPRGTWVLIGSGAGKGNFAGLSIVDKGLKSFHRLASETAHSDVGLDARGNEVIVMQNNRTDHIDLIPLDPATQPVESPEGYAKSTIKPLIRLFYAEDSPDGLGSGVHISCNHAGYCLVSTVTEPRHPEKNWLDRTITLVRLDPQKPRVFYLAKVYNTSGAYWEETHGSITNDGRKAVWASNWGQHVGQEKAFLMVLDLPPLPAP